LYSFIGLVKYFLRDTTKTETSSLAQVTAPMLTKLWRTIRGLRELERTAPEKLRVNAAKLEAAKQQLKRATEEKERLHALLAERMSQRMELAKAEQAINMERKQEAFKKALSTITVDPHAIQARVMEDLVSNWEQTLQDGDATDAPSPPGKPKGAKE
jgi:lipopolysaccharide biosynthesis regulator YciM